MTKEQFLKADFDKFLRYTKIQKNPFTFALFVDFASSLLNFYVGSNSISNNEKETAALFLIKCYNEGLPRPMDQEDISTLSELILQSSLLDYALLAPIFEKETN